MIRNEREYRITHAQAEKFRAALAQTAAAPAPKGVHPKLHDVSKAALRAQLEELEEQLRSYEALKSGKSRARLKGRVEELGELLVQARIARKWTQKHFAERLGLKMQQVQRDEASSYKSASLTRILEACRVLGAEAAIELKLVELPEAFESLATAGKASGRK